MGEQSVVTLRRRDPMERIEWMFDRLCDLADCGSWEMLAKELHIMRFGLPAMLPEVCGLPSQHFPAVVPNHRSMTGRGDLGTGGDGAA